MKHTEVLFPYLNGEDLNTDPAQSPSRWIINFFDWPLRRQELPEGRWVAAGEKQRKAWLKNGIVPLDYPSQVAADFPDCLRIVEEKVKPERMKNNRKERRDKWWHYAEKCPALYRTIAPLKRVLTRPLTSKHHGFVFLPRGIVYDQTIPVFAFDDYGAFALLQSEVHNVWGMAYGATLETRPRYTPSDCFETFPFPAITEELTLVGEQYHEQRRKVMLDRKIGLTEIYNQLHDPQDQSDELVGMREFTPRPISWLQKHMAGNRFPFGMISGKLAMVFASRCRRNLATLCCHCCSS